MLKNILHTKVFFSGELNPFADAKSAVPSSTSVFGGSTFGASSFGSSSFGSKSGISGENPFSRVDVESSEKEPSGFGGFARKNSGSSFGQPVETAKTENIFASSSDNINTASTETGSIFGSNSDLPKRSFGLSSQSGSESQTEIGGSIFGSGTSKTGGFRFNAKPSGFDSVKEEVEKPSSGFGNFGESVDKTGSSSGFGKSSFGSRSVNPFSSVTKPLFDAKEGENETVSESTSEPKIPKKTSAVLIIHGLTDDIRNGKFIQGHIGRFGDINQIRLVSSKQAAKGMVFKYEFNLLY